jgi:hypothetical protein
VQSSRVSRGLVAGLVVVALPVLSGCVAVSGSQTQEPYTPSDGVWANSNGLQLRNVIAVAPRDGEATLVGTILNNGGSADSLVSVRVNGARTRLGSAPLELPAGQTKQLGVDTGLGRAVPASLEGSSLKSGSTIPMTFEFERAGDVRLDVLVVPQSGYYATVPAPSDAPSPSRTTPPIPG